MPSCCRRPLGPASGDPHPFAAHGGSAPGSLGSPAPHPKCLGVEPRRGFEHVFSRFCHASAASECFEELGRAMEDVSERLLYSSFSFWLSISLIRLARPRLGAKTRDRGERRAASGEPGAGPGSSWHTPWASKCLKNACKLAFCARNSLLEDYFTFETVRSGPFHVPLRPGEPLPALPPPGTACL